ncbi:MAG: AMP-binding protein, partial [Proteobacteria bacterium]|nr:AMP-binding protein [Pseudomonadota bacterium]
MNASVDAPDAGRPRARADHVGAWLADLAHRFGDRPALSAAIPGGAGPACSYAELERASGALTAGLHGLGLRSGDAVAIWLPNRPEWLVAHLAATRLG